jgi:uncharacterized protein (UPF0548 family)
VSRLFLLRRPADLEPFRRASEGVAPTAAAWAMEGNPPPPAGYALDHNRVLLGQGEDAWRRARAALDAWAMFDQPWVQVHPRPPAIRVGEQVVILATQLDLGGFGLWVRNVARIAWVVDQAGPSHRYGFCYVTLPDHVEQGAERFEVRWDRASDEVCFDLRAYSRPGHWLAKLGKPWVRRQQRRFAVGALAAMRAAVG